MKVGDQVQNIKKGHPHFGLTGTIIALDPKSLAFEL